nr:MAG TPA_asm: hypothetical protein [Caudoviricetes sp.]
MSKIKEQEISPALKLKGVVKVFILNNNKGDGLKSSYTTSSNYLLYRY